MAVLFASVIGLACGLLTMCVRAIAWLVKLFAIVKTAPEAPELRAFKPLRGDVLETIAVERIEDRLDELEGASRHSRTTHDQAHLRPH